jgi:cytochrome c oxidase subunit 3
MTAVAPALSHQRESRITELPIEAHLGTNGMTLFIATEGFLFVLLFFSYFFLARGSGRWLSEEPPKLGLAFALLAILVLSSVTIAWGERQLKAQRTTYARLSLIATFILGLVFVAVQAQEYREHLRTLTPRTDVYGSIFYTITSFHAAHVGMGLLMLLFVLLIPRYRAPEQLHRSYRNAAMYWHFVDVVWVFVVALLYVLPNIR